MALSSPDAAIAVKFDEIREEETDPVQRVRPLGVPCDLRTLPRAHVGIEFAAELQHLLLQALDFGFPFIAGGQAAQLFHIFFQALDFALAFDRGYGFLLFMCCAH